jgi:hypothetical protein
LLPLDVSRPPERRKHPRDGTDPRASLRQTLRSWQLLQKAWKVVFEGAVVAHNYERMALAEAKLDECARELVRVEKLLST